MNNEQLLQRNGANKKEWSDQNFIWGRRQAYADWSHLSKLKPLQKDKADYRYSVNHRQMDSIRLETHWQCKGLLWIKQFIIANGVELDLTARDWSDENHNDNGWNSITRGYGIYTEGGSGVKVKLTLNTLSELSHKRSRVHETFLEEFWRKEHGQYCLTIISLLFCLSMCEIIV